MAREELTRLTGNGNGTCGEDDCPNVYRTASGSIVVQGDVSDVAHLSGPPYTVVAMAPRVGAVM
ncbi:hypothetical protein [Streptomyces marianii]|uniref:Uncharacterized protein n=1 Tax=Streptomyces marianii TaxID=1817406 RepID=A0A5R9E869_9ACTN|nr:hypothetical protein [Streptomyces marianii]TLQ45245.1 hypothetical protein FEF34_21370 [Streptomyces marianii]